MAGTMLCLILLHAGSAPADQAWTEVFSVAIAGQRFSTEHAELPFLPGRANVLTVAPAWDKLSVDEVIVAVKKTQPDGRADTSEQRLPRGKVGEFALGPMTAPAAYEFEAGVVHRRGYRLEVTLTDSTRKQQLALAAFHQALAAKPIICRQGQKLRAGPERFLPGPEERLVYNPAWGVGDALEMRLRDDVLFSPEAAGLVMCALNHGGCVDKLACKLQVRGPDGKELVEESVEIGVLGKWVYKTLKVKDWPAGDYELGLYPVLDSKVWREGPRVVYRRRQSDPSAVRVSPLAPWTLTRDKGRADLEITDFEEACGKWGAAPPGWQFQANKEGKSLVCPAGARPKPVSLRLPLNGCYALFAQPHGDGCLIQAGAKGLVRSILTRQTRGAVFVWAGDLPGQPIRIYAFDPWNKPASGLMRLKLVPVDGPSVAALYQATGNPPTPLYGVNDWAEYFHGPCRLEADQFDAIVGAQREIGLRTLDWSIGRSWVEYHSRLPSTTRFPCVPIDQAAPAFPGAHEYYGRATMIANQCPLTAVLGGRSRLDAKVWAWQAMNRHYGADRYGGMLASRFFREHPEWHDWTKNYVKPDGSVVCYFFPKVRKERVDILLEVTRKGVDGLLIGCCRQVPMLRYHPEMVKAYREKTGVDPLRIDAATGQAYRDWIRWRADFFTEVLRDVRQELRGIEKESGRRVLLGVRVPSAGLFYNLAQGCDVETWLREGLIDQLQLDPLEDCGGRASHDVRPYVEICRAHKIPVIGGIGSPWSDSFDAYVPALRRALGLLDAGVDGIEFYETELLARCSDFRWLLPLMGDARRLRTFLAESNLEACCPVTASSAAYGHDNHSRFHAGGWSVFGRNGL